MENILNNALHVTSHARVLRVLGVEAGGTCQSTPCSVGATPLPRAPLGQEDVARVGAGSFATKIGVTRTLPCSYLPLLAPTCPYGARHGTARRGT